jgi:hypothetical protein
MHGQLAMRVSSQREKCHPRDKAGIGFSKDRSADGSIQYDCSHGDEASFIAAKHFFDLDAARALRDTASDLPQ